MFSLVHSTISLLYLRIPDIFSNVPTMVTSEGESPDISSQPKGSVQSNVFPVTLGQHNANDVLTNIM
jgi:hypothetical protein